MLELTVPAEEEVSSRLPRSGNVSPNIPTWRKSAGRLAEKLPRRSGMWGLRWVLNCWPALRQGMRRSSMSRSHQRIGGGGREGQLLAAAKKKAQGLWSTQQAKM